MAKIRCAVVGLGRIGSSLEGDKLREKPASHAGAIIHNPKCTLVGGADISKNAQIIFKKKWKCDNVYDNAQELLDKQNPDILHIAVPPDSHEEMILMALAKKVPVVICEKPITEDLASAKRVLNASENNQKSTILINHERRYAAPYRHVMERIKSCKYGVLLSITSKLYMGKNRDVSDMLLDDGTHLIDTIQFFTDSGMRDIFSRYFHSQKQNSILVTANCGDISVFFEIASGRDHIVFEIDLSFSDGRIRIGNGLYEEFESKSSPFYERQKSLIRNKIKFKKTKYFSNMLEEAVGLFNHQISSPSSSVEESYKVMRAIDKINRQRVERQT
jgi:predicted dehydrogenase